MNTKSIERQRRGIRPASDAELIANYRAGAPCTHTFKETQEFLSNAGLPVAKTIEWLRHNGAGCDCEVIFNTDAEWGEHVGRIPHDE